MFYFLPYILSYIYYIYIYSICLKTKQNKVEKNEIRYLIPEFHTSFIFNIYFYSVSQNILFICKDKFNSILPLFPINVHCRYCTQTFLFIYYCYHLYIMYHIPNYIYTVLYIKCLFKRILYDIRYVI